MSHKGGSLPRALTSRVLVLLVIVLGLTLSTPLAAPAAETTGLTYAGTSPTGTSPRAASAPGISPRDCALLGRRHLGRRGCARFQCLPGAVPFKNSQDAEMCTLRGKRIHGFGAAVEYRRCMKLGRRWIHQVNWCASNPSRSTALIRDAAQCVGKKTDYVTLRESEGRYDMCLRPRLADRMIALAKREGTSIAKQVMRRSRLQCGYRPRHVFVDGRCRRRLSEGPRSSDGSLLIGDSIAWRGTDELTPLVEDLTVDGIPSRNFTRFASRLKRYRDDQGAPRGLIVELGTNGAGGKFSRRALNRIIGSLPSATVVMFVIPHRGTKSDPARTAQFTRKYAAWMRDLEVSRPRTCTADWSALVRARPNVLADGVHPRHEHEGFWARWIAREWRGCRSSVG